jgi:uncharacterized protein YceH (UPF0502 family)
MESAVLNIEFTPNEARVIGSLMEKSVITPDQYPLSLNSLVNACNQKSSRDPVMTLEQAVVQRTVNDLIARRFVMVQNFGSRVDKYQQRLCGTQFPELELTPAECAIVCLLLLRGPQTPGELKVHSGRLHEFADTAEVEAALESLMSRSAGALVARLPREPRRKDHAYAQLFGGPVESAPKSVPADDDAPTRPAGGQATLEARVATLERELAALKQALGVP